MAIASVFAFNNGRASVRRGKCLGWKTLRRRIDIRFIFSVTLLSWQLSRIALALPSICEAKLGRLASQIGLDFDLVLAEFKGHVPILLAGR